MAHNGFGMTEGRKYRFAHSSVAQGRLKEERRKKPTSAVKCRGYLTAEVTPSYCGGGALTAAAKREKNVRHDRVSPELGL